MQEDLIKIGLTEQEAKIYLELLKQKYSLASEISSITKINRSVTYTILNSLESKGLCSHVIRNNRKYFAAANPKTLIDFLKDKEQILSDLMPKLENLQEKEKEKVTVELYQGITGGITVLKDIIRTEQDYLALGVDGRFQKEFPAYLKQFIRQLKEKNIHERILAKEGSEIIKHSNSTIKYLPKELQFPTITTIYENKIAIAIFTKPFYCILIKSKELADNYRTFFEILWKIAK